LFTFGEEPSTSLNKKKAPDRWNGYATQPAGIQDGLTITPAIALDPKD
jgi:hypothetical protein